MGYSDQDHARGGPPSSPRIAALAGELASGDRLALDAFWARLEIEGTPIVETIEGEPDRRWLTFVWRDAAADTRSVELWGGPASGEKDQDNGLTRLEGTDLWTRTYRVPSDLRGHYRFTRNHPKGEPRTEDGPQPDLLPDPLNPNRLEWPGYPLDPKDHDSVFSLIELADAPARPWAAPRPASPPGEIEEHTVPSEVLRNERRVWVYRPAAASKGEPPAGLPAGVMVLLDGWEWSCVVPAAPTFDNLIAEGAIPPLVVVMPESLDHLVRGRELPCNPQHARFLADELLPWARSRWDLTDDPSRTIVAGQSYGGLASAFAALERPDVFGNVVSQSGSFWWKDDSEFDEEAEMLSRRFALEPKVPVRFWLEVGLLEGTSMLSPNRHLRDVLVAKGYEVTYSEHTYDHWWPSWLGTLPDALRSITASWR